MEREIWYDLDPDNNKKDPNVSLFCCRCKRKLKEIKSFISVELHPDHYWVRINPIGKHLLGSECAKKLEKVPIEIIAKYG